MEGGVISDNTTTSSGGGVFMRNSSITMTGGEITGNRASSSGGGVFADGGGIRKTGGTIFGYTEGDINSNTVMQGIVGGNRGHAVYSSTAYQRRRESTAGPRVNLDSSTSANWEN